jgi:hypothetical protein
MIYNKFHYEAEPVKLFRETVAVYSENHTKLTNTLCEKNTKF